MTNLLFDFISKYINLNKHEKDVINSLGIFSSKKKGDILLKENEKSNKGYFVLKGCIRQYYNVDGNEKTTAFYTELEGLTPTCVVTKEVSEYYISCVEDSILLMSTPEMEKEVFEKFPKFEKLCRILAEENLSKQQIDFDRFKISSPEERYLNLLNNRPDLIQRIPQHQLSSFIGVKPQSLSRIKARIVEKNK
ncbi:Crp/Fnr family transcriptional regulator [Algibacter pacificus]|uniref:Crp/Fnr family transcriptional regulator n=1 Tax=Algibacter pacificus TaxID=2599389 RepID=UPI0011CB7A76|nr:cyclic nucleotide-binding domain-containing protein [Algibacter pacificus]